MENKTNERVPMAILSCFLIAFILQGILKINGVFVFEKALDWQIFNFIESSKWLRILYYGVLNTYAVYCFSFVFTTRWYSKKWYHYLIIVIPTTIVVIIKQTVIMPLKLQFLTDIILYVIVPLTIYFTTNKQDRLFADLSVFNVVTIISLQLFMYFGYLGLTYWSGLLNSFIPILQHFPRASTMFLIYFEVYMAELLILLSCNFMIRKFKNKEV